MKTRRDSSRHNLLIALAALMIAGSIAAYCLLFFRWLGGRPLAQPFSPKAPAAAPADLSAARAEFRDRFLDPAARLRLAEALYARGRWVDAFYVMHETREFFGDEAFRRAHRRVVLGRDAFLGDGVFDPSADNERRLKERLAANPADADASAYLARVFESRGDREGAQKYAQAGLAARPSDPSLMLLSAELTAAADPTAGITLYARLANAVPASREGRRALEALGKFARKRPEEAPGEAGALAQEALQELFKARPKEPAIFAALALSVLKRGDAAGARALCADALRKDPGNPGALMVEGAIALSEGDAAMALKDLSQAWRQNPDDLYSAAELARIYDRERGDRESALPYYIALFREDPDYAPGAPVEQQIIEILDARRKALLDRQPAGALERFLSSEDGSLRAEACARAAQSRDPRWVDELAERLDDDADIVRHNADYALYQLAARYPDAVRVRKDEWLKSPRPFLRARALNLFADLFAQETFPAVVAALHDQNPAVRFFAKTMILDHYYKDLPAARKAAAEYLSVEKDQAVLALYARMAKS